MKKEDLRIVFMGTPEFAVGSLRALVEGGYNVVAVVTQPDKPVGRHGSVLRAPEVKEYALSVGLPVLQPEKMKGPKFVEELRSYNASLQVVVAFRMLPEIVWAMPRFGTFNVHASLLPQYRGAAPINWAVINGETETGVTTFFLDHTIDTGRIIMQRRMPIPPDADAGQVYDGLMKLGAEVCTATVDEIIATDGHVETQPQPVMGVLMPAPKLFKETCETDWTQGAQHVCDFIRGLSPYPGAWTTLVHPDGTATVMKLFKAVNTGRQSDKPTGSVMVEHGHLYATAADEWIEIEQLQMAGKKRMAAKDFINGFKNVEGCRLLHTGQF